MRILIFGATGMLGRALMREWSGEEVTGRGSADADIRIPEQVQRQVSRARPDWILLSAAYTDVDGCELNPELAAAVNTQGAVNVARAASQANARLLFVSTDYVFDGNKGTPYETGDHPHPINSYGRSKAEAEERVREILPRACIVRTSWLFGPGGRCFPDTILQLAVSRGQIDVVNDQRGCPTYTRDLAAAMAQLCRAGAEGIVHCTNQGECTWYEFARAIVAQAGVQTVVRPTTSDKFVRPAERPRYSVLSSTSLSEYGITMPPWPETIAPYLMARLARVP
jgi:dTDP-4-dehydrorhamnose reductase